VGVLPVADVTWPAFVADASTFPISFLIVSRVARGAGRSAWRAADYRGPLRNGLGSSRDRGPRRHDRRRRGDDAGARGVNVLFVPLMVRTLGVPALARRRRHRPDGFDDPPAGTVAVLAARLRPTRIVVVGLAGMP
jgi:hypothetical protein